MPPRHAILLVALGFGSLTGCVRSPEARAENWWSARTAHVHLQSDTGRDRTAQAAAQLEALQQALGTAFYHCGAPDDRVIDVTLLARDDEYMEIAGTTRGQFMRARDGVAPLPRRVLLRDAVLREVGGTQTFAHELTHALVDACFPQAPPWLHEGLATVFQTVGVVDGSVRVGAPAYRITGSAYFDQIFLDGFVVLEVPRSAVAPPSQLVVTSSADFHSDSDGLQGPGSARSGRYAGAWALVHLLALGPDADLRARFRAYLSSLAGSSDVDPMPLGVAFAGMDLDARVDDYVRSARFDVAQRPFSPVEAAPVLEPLSRPEAHLALAELALAAHGIAGYADATPHLEAGDASPVRPRALVLRAAFAPDRQRELVEEALRLAPDDRDVLRAGVFVARGEHDYATADERAMRLAAQPDLDVPMLLMVATLERHMGRLDAALDHAMTALHRDRTSWQTWFVLSRIAAARSDWSLARRAVHFVETFARRSAPAVVALAIRWLGRIDAAAAGTGPIEEAINPF